tara:strand:- start:4 stop:1671 length:1668 start_codon:yes stop_codon:yes gene_type:complete
MADFNEDLSKKFLNYLDNKQFKRLQFEADTMGDVEKQHPIIMFYYASSIYLQESSKIKDLIYAGFLFEKVYLIDKSKLQSLYNAISVSLKTRSFRTLLPLVLEAYEKDKKDVKLIEGLARIYFFLGNREESITLFRTLYEMLPEKMEGRLSYISSLNYASGVSQEQYFKECSNFTTMLEKKFAIDEDKFKFDWKKNGKIKISFLSADFKTHSVSHFLKDLLKKTNKEKFEIHLISNLTPFKQDDMSQELKKIAHKWHDVENIPDDELISYLRSLKLDILIDLSGFTNGNRFEVLLWRCAKIQIGWLGYNNTLCSKNIDYFIFDRNLVMENEFKLYKEKILFLPNIWNALSSIENLPEIENKSNLSSFTFCSFNNFQKISDRTINVWSKILTKTKSKLLLKSSLIGGEDLQNNVLEKFVKNGVLKDQIIIFDYKSDILEHYKLYNKANVALDTFPYPGVTTTCEALLMGLPVLTMRGFNANSRCGESILKNIKMNDLIANDDEDYLNKAISLTKIKDLYKSYGINLRNKALSSPLFDTDQFTKDFEELITNVYKKN